jgi:hypothetical protein
MCRHAAIDLDDCYLSGPEPMHRPDYRAKKKTRPLPKSLRRQKWHKPQRVRAVWLEKREGGAA